MRPLIDIDEKDRWSSQKISNGAMEYLDAAKKLQTNALTGTNPFWFCVSQSIELSFKSFLRAKGFTKDKLKTRNLGHNLRELLKLCDQKGLSEFIKLGKDDRKIICLLGDMYSWKAFQYSETGWSERPYANHGVNIADKLYRSTRPIAGRLRTFHHDKDTAVH